MINRATLVGNVGKDPEVRYLDENTSVASFPLATSEKYKKSEGEVIENTEWHNCKAWKGLASIVEKYVKKGSKLYIEGKIKTRSYDDKDGVKRYATEIVCDQLVMLDSKQV
jgi:single-strand DNA-binding protein